MGILIVRKKKKNVFFEIFMVTHYPELIYKKRSFGNLAKNYYTILQPG